MSQQIIPSLAYPTTIVFVDDDEKFLKQIGTIIGRDWPCILFKDPQKAVAFLKHYPFEPFTNRCVQRTEEPFPDQPSIEVNLRQIRKEVFNPNRSKEISTVILDFAMPDINGGQVAEQLKGLPYKIILLTGEASTQMAVKLFNDGTIHSYIRKDDPHFKTLLFQSIKNLQEQYFQDLSGVVVNSILNHYWPKDPIFKKLFDKIYEMKQIKEYFLLDEFGSYQLFDAMGNLSFLAVANSDLMQTYLLYIEGDDSPAALIEPIKSRTKMPFFYSDEDFNVGPADWGPYMHPLEVIKGREVYYYSHISHPDPKIYTLGDKIKPYDVFLNELG